MIVLHWWLSSSSVHEAIYEDFNNILFRHCKSREQVFLLLFYEYIYENWPAVEFKILQEAVSRNV